MTEFESSQGFINDATAAARPTNAQPGGVGVGRGRALLLPRLGGLLSLSSFQCGQCPTESLSSVVFEVFSHHSLVWSNKCIVLQSSSFQYALIPT